MMEYGDQTNVPDELTSLEVTGDVLRFTMPSETLNIKLTDNLGRVISNTTVNGMLWETIEVKMPFDRLPSGIYMISAETPVSRDIIKVVR
jgi:hypothetical protein